MKNVKSLMHGQMVVSSETIKAIERNTVMRQAIERQRENDALFVAACRFGVSATTFWSRLALLLAVGFCVAFALRVTCAA